MSSSLWPHGLQHTRLPILHYLPEFAQMPVYCVNDAIQPTHPVTFFYSCPQCFPASGSFPVNQLFTSGGQNIRASASASILPMNIWWRFPLGLTGLISLQSKGLSSSPAPQFESINSLALSLLYGPTLTPVHDYIALTIQTFAGKVMSPLFNTLWIFVIAFLTRSKRF